jgi:hypothetical protein
MLPEIRRSKNASQRLATTSFEVCVRFREDFVELSSGHVPLDLPIPLIRQKFFEPLGELGQFLLGQFRYRCSISGTLM